MSTDDSSRLDAMEKKIIDLTSRLDNTSSPTDKKTRKTKPKNAEKRAPTVYNNFMKDHIQKAKSEWGDSDGKFDHKKAFSAAAADWSKSKVAKKESSE